MTMRVLLIFAAISFSAAAFAQSAPPKVGDKPLVKVKPKGLAFTAAFRRATGPSGHTNSPHPSSREGHLSTAWWNSSFLLSHLVTCVPHATAASRVHRNSVPSTQMRCMITANRRASATIAFFIPRCLAIFIAQALSHDHFAKRTSMI